MPDQQRDVLIATLYQQGVPVAEVAARAGVCIKTVRNVARRYGLPPRKPSQPERDALVAAAYKAGDKVASIANRYGIPRPRVRTIAQRAGLPPRVNWRQRYPLDETAFDDPTEVGWWLIGLLAADGSIHEGEQRVSLCQTLDDADVLHAFYDYVGCPDRPLTMLNLSEAAKARQYPRRPAAEARIFSKRIVSALARHGVVPRKTASMELSSAAASQTAVWLGILDGDGSVGNYRGGREPRVRFFGTRQLMTQCERFWRRTLAIESSSPAARPHRRGIWVFELGGRRARAAAALLVSSSPTSMKRKRAKLLALIAGSTLYEPGAGACASRGPQRSCKSKGETRWLLQT
jgi:lambda repressor-like predicted transcriptional regulator